MKIGILTFNDTKNYGAQLQAFALQETIKNFGVDCYHIKTFKKNLTIKSFLRNLINFFSNIAFKKFSRNIDYINCLYSLENIDELLNTFDTFISGSDQVWNLTNGFNEIFYQTFVTNNSKKISYAASFGIDKISEVYFEKLKKALNDFDYISVREKTAQKMIQPLCSKKVERVLDPVFLHDEVFWSSLATKHYKKDYIFVYGTQMTSAIVSEAQKLRIKTGLKIYSVFPMKGATTVSKNIGPLEFISLVRDAKYVLTTSFHCVAFSIIFKKQLVVFLHNTTGSRTNDLLELFEMQQCLFNASNDYASFVWNYEKSNAILMRERKHSLEFLKNALLDENS